MVYIYFSMLVILEAKPLIRRFFLLHILNDGISLMLLEIVLSLHVMSLCLLL